MQKILQIIYTVLFIAIAFLVFYCFYSIWQAFLALPSEILATIIAAVSTILVSVLSVTVGKYYERKRVIENELREKKIPMYEEFIDFNFKVFMGGKGNVEEMTEQEMVDFFNSFTQKLMVWGSDEVVNLWSIYRRKLVKKSSVEENKQGKPIEHDEQLSPLNLMYDFENLLLAIRKDIGHKNKDITKGALLGLFINDMDEQEKEQEKKQEKKQKKKD